MDDTIRAQCSHICLFSKSHKFNSLLGFSDEHDDCEGRPLFYNDSPRNAGDNIFGDAIQFVCVISFSIIFACFFFLFVLCHPKNVPFSRLLRKLVHIIVIPFGRSFFGDSMLLFFSRFLAPTWRTFSIVVVFCYVLCCELRKRTPSLSIWKSSSVDVDFCRFVAVDSLAFIHVFEPTTRSNHLLVVKLSTCCIAFIANDIQMVDVRLALFLWWALAASSAFLKCSKTKINSVARIQ